MNGAAGQVNSRLFAAAERAKARSLECLELDTKFFLKLTPAPKNMIVISDVSATVT